MGDRHLMSPPLADAGFAILRTWNAYGTCNVTSYSTGHPQSARLCDDLRPPEKSRGETGQSITTRPKSRNLCRWLHRSRASQRGLHRDPLRVVHHGSRAAHPSLERWRFDLPVHALRGPKGEEGRRGRGGVGTRTGSQHRCPPRGWQGLLCRPHLRRSSNHAPQQVTESCSFPSLNVSVVESEKSCVHKWDVFKVEPDDDPTILELPSLSPWLSGSQHQC